MSGEVMRATIRKIVPYDWHTVVHLDAVPFARHLVERFSDRVLWGTDWPHPNIEAPMPDDGDLVDPIPPIAPSAVHQRAILVGNPTRLYWS